MGLRYPKCTFLVFRKDFRAVEEDSSAGVWWQVVRMLSGLAQHQQDRQWGVLLL